MDLPHGLALLKFLLTRPYGRDLHAFIHTAFPKTFLLTRPYGRDHLNFPFRICSFKFLLTRPYGRDPGRVTFLLFFLRFYSHAHTGVIPDPRRQRQMQLFLLTRPYGRDLPSDLLSQSMISFLLTRPYGRDHIWRNIVRISDVSTHTPIRA